METIKKYIISQLVEVTAWIGLILIFAAFFAPREYIAVFGVVLIALDDKALRDWVLKKAPGLAAKIEEWTK